MTQAVACDMTGLQSTTKRPCITDLHRGLAFFRRLGGRAGHAHIHIGRRLFDSLLRSAFGNRFGRRLCRGLGSHSFLGRGLFRYRSLLGRRGLGLGFSYAVCVVTNIAVLVFQLHQTVDIGLETWALLAKFARKQQ